MLGRIVLAGLLAAAAGCAAGEIRYPGRASVRAGDPPLIWIYPTGSPATDPEILRVPTGTEVTWRNASGSLAFIRFNQRIEEVCGEPYRFGPNYDGTSYDSSIIPSVGDARLCFARPGRYDFIVSLNSGGGDSRDTGNSSRGVGDGGSSTKYGTVIVE